MQFGVVLTKKFNFPFVFERCSCMPKDLHFLAGIVVNITERAKMLRANSLQELFQRKSWFLSIMLEYVE